MAEKIKKYNKYRYNKITPKMLGKAKNLRLKGYSYAKIGKELSVSYQTINYHLDEKYKQRAKKKARDRMRNLSKEEMMVRSRKYYKNQRDYIRERYNNDPEFRSHLISLVKKNRNKQRKGWIKKGLCQNCGKEKKDKKWKFCEKCRKKSRERKK